MYKIVKKAMPLVKVLEEQIKFEIAYFSNQKSQQNQFRILDNRAFGIENSKNLLLYKTFMDTSLNKQYEVFVKSDLSSILKYDYRIDNEEASDRLGSIFNTGKMEDMEYIKAGGSIGGVQHVSPKVSRHLAENFVKVEQESFMDVMLGFSMTFYTKIIKTDIVIRDKLNKKNSLFLQTLVDFDSRSLYVERVMPFVDKEAVDDNNLIIVPKSLLKSETKFQTDLIKGPYFAYLDPTIQRSLYDLFKNWGIVENKQLVVDIFNAAEQKEQDLYLDWLFRLKDHAVKKTK